MKSTKVFVLVFVNPSLKEQNQTKQRQQKLHQNQKPTAKTKQNILSSTYIIFLEGILYIRREHVI